MFDCAQYIPAQLNRDAPLAPNLPSSSPPPLQKI